MTCCGAGLRRAVVPVLLALVVPGCRAEGRDEQAAVGEVADQTRAPGPLRASLEDDVRPRPGTRIAWSTTWRLCWPAHPGAVAYELEPVTGEGAGSARRQRTTCRALEAAAGENRRSEGLAGRDLQLALQKGQLAYRVRAVFADGGVTPWSRAVPVGEATGG